MKVRISGIDFKLTDDSKRAKDLGLQFGFCDWQNSIINIDSDQHRANQKEVLIHEIVEAINNHFELELEHNKISILSTALNQVIEDNPHLFTNKFKGVK